MKNVNNVDDLYRFKVVILLYYTNDLYALKKVILHEIS